MSRHPGIKLPSSRRRSESARDALHEDCHAIAEMVGSLEETNAAYENNVHYRDGSRALLVLLTEGRDDG